MPNTQKITEHTAGTIPDGTERYRVFAVLLGQVLAFVSVKAHVQLWRRRSLACTAALFASRLRVKLQDIIPAISRVSSRHEKRPTHTVQPFRFKGNLKL